MKLKKILAGALAAAMVLTSVPIGNLRVKAAAIYETDDVTIKVASDPEIAIKSSNGYRKYDNSMITGVSAPSEETTNGGAASNAIAKDTTSWHTKWSESNVLTNGKGYIEFTLSEAQTVTGFLYYCYSMANEGYAKRARLEVMVDGENSYKTVYETDAATPWLKEAKMQEILFTPVENVKKVKFTVLSAYGNSSTNEAQAAQMHAMRLMTVPDNAKMVTINATSSNSNLGTVSVATNTVIPDDGIEVLSGTTVRYQATSANNSVEFLGWKNNKNQFVSNDKTYEITATENTDTELTAVFKQLTIIDIPTAGATETQLVSGDTGYQSNSTNMKVVNPPNISASSEENPSRWTNDGAAYWAFCDNQNWWHSKYDDSNNNNKTFDKATKATPIWIQAGFSQSENSVVHKVKKINYTPRKTGNSGAGLGTEYQILVANSNSLIPNSADFTVAATGTLSETTPNHGTQEIVLDHAVEATHVRLRFTDSADENKCVTASQIVMYEDRSATIDDGTLKKIVPISVTSANDKRGTVTATTTAGGLSEPETVNYIVQDYGLPVTITATAKAGYQFAKWNVKNQSDEIVDTIMDATTTITMNDNTLHYEAVFATEGSSLNLNKTSLLLKKWATNDAILTSGTETLTATATSTSTEAPQVIWTSTNAEVATVNAGVVTAVASGKTTIRAALGSDKEVYAECVVTVDDATELQSKITDITSDVGEDISENTLKFKYRSDGEHASDLTDFINAYNAAKTDTTESVETLLTNLTNVYDNLQPLYKVTVDISGIDGLNLDDVKLESKYTTDNLKTNSWLAGSDATSKWIYVPMIEKVTVSVPETVTTTSENRSFTEWDDITTGTAVKAANAREYSFYVVDSWTYKPMYTAATPVSDIINYCRTKYAKSTGKLSFVAKRNVPRDGYIIREHGVVITDRIGWSKYYKENVNAFKKGATRTRKSTAKGKAHSGTYEAIMTAKQVGESKEWYGRSYIEYVKVKDGKIETDENGNEILYTNYSKVVPYPATSSVTN